MIFNRKIMNEIIYWNDNQSNNTALLIEGVRRVGKTTICEEFAKKYYPNNYIIVDFMYVSKQLKELFDDINIYNLDNFFSNLFLLITKVVEPGGLIIFDEIQRCPNARQAIKLLVKDNRYKYIETGSLISIRDNVKDITIPSEERRIEMHPLDFEEFLWAFNKETLGNQIKEAFKNNIKLNNSTHENLIQEYRRYIALGGMPKVLDTFINTLSYKRAHEEKENIIKLYKDDLHKFDLNHKTSCEPLYNSIPSMLMNRESSRFIITNVEERFSLLEKSINDLNDSKIVNLVNKITDPTLGLELSKVNSLFKLYASDSGLLVTDILKNNDESIEDIYKKIIFNKSDMNFGRVYESFVAQSLISNKIKPYYHTYTIVKDNKEKKYEIDFIATIKGKTTAIEVKSGKNFTTSSLDNLKIKYPQISFNKIVISSKPYNKKDDVTYIPLYMIFCI